MTTKRKDFTQTALDVVRRATRETAAPVPSKKLVSGCKALSQRRPKKQSAQAE